MASNREDFKNPTGHFFFFQPHVCTQLYLFQRNTLLKATCLYLYWDNMVTDVTTKATGCLYTAAQGQASQELHQLQPDLSYEAFVPIVLKK